MWEIEYTDEFGDWWDDLTEDQQEALHARMLLLQQHGPNLRRPTVGEIKGSANDPQMKELICDAESAHMRVLFIFDPRRTAILLVGGDKTGNWKSWYSEAIPEADALYEIYLDEIRKEGLI